MDNEPPHYFSYLLRLWQVQSQGQTLWRASLESPLTGKVSAFPDLESMFRHLENQIDPGRAAKTGPNHTDNNDDFQRA